MKKSISFFFLLFSIYALGQEPNDCGNAIVVCGNTNISSNVSGFGIQELDATENTCSYEEANSLWLSVNIATAGTLAFTLRPNSLDISVDYDFYVYGPNSNCTNLNDPIRCSTTNPIQANLSDNLTGMRDSETDQNEGPGELGNSFISSVPVTAGEQYYILIDRPIGEGGFNLEWTGSAGFLSPPDVNKPLNIEVCTAELPSTVDISQNPSAITSSPNALIQYYNTYEDAFDQNNNFITDPTQFSFSGATTDIFIRVSNPNGCFDITDFSLIPLEFDAAPNLSYTLCDSDRDGQEAFSIPQIIGDIENGIGNIMEFMVTLHPDETSANNDMNRLNGTTYSTATTNIYARVSSAILADCAITFPVSLTVIEDNFPASINLVQCDVDETDSTDGITRLNLEQTFPDTSGFDVFFYESTTDRTNDNAIVNPGDYSNTTPFNQTVYYKISTDTCESFGEITLEVNPTVVSLNTTSPIMVCDDSVEDGVVESTFDLEEIRQTSYANLDVAFYGNLDDVSLEVNQLEGNFRTPSTIIYARLENSNQCQGVEELELVVNPLPEIMLEENYQVCTDGEPITVMAPDGFDVYTWYRINGTQAEELGTDTSILISEGGNYRLEVGIAYSQNGQMVTCPNSVDFTVTPSNRATFQEITVEEVNGNNSIKILVTGDGDYEYSLDGEIYQDSNRFDDIDAGFYTAFVRDKNGCGIAEKEVAIIGFPKFFTPNGDGNNDLWQIIGAGDDLEQNSITIYDRYGKLLKQLRISEQGWDGTFNGKMLPASDYWFRLTLAEGKEFKGHFSLKR